MASIGCICIVHLYDKQAAAFLCLRDAHMIIHFGSTWIFHFVLILNPLLQKGNGTLTYSGHKTFISRFLDKQHSFIHA